MPPQREREEVCLGPYGHAEVVRVIDDPNASYETLLKEFLSHTIPRRACARRDVGTQYRSAIYTTSDAQQKAAEASKARTRRR
jgi:peptide-methionine (S)-S-oxide reductase